MSSFYGSGGIASGKGGKILAEQIYICGVNEYDAVTGLPSINNPEEGKFYLVPLADEEENNLFNQYIYKNDHWEKFGSGGVKINFDNTPIAGSGNAVASGGLNDYIMIVPGTGTGSAIVKDNNNEASGQYSFASGYGTIASGAGSHTEGNRLIFLENSERTDLSIILSGVKNTLSYVIDNSDDADTVVTSDYLFMGQEHQFLFNDIRATVNKVEADQNNNFLLKLDKTINPTEDWDKQRVIVIPLMIASGKSSHAEGAVTAAEGYASHTEGAFTIASDYAHAEGVSTKATATAAHAQGRMSIASGDTSHAEGDRTKSTSYGSHAEGQDTTASDSGAHAEGINTIASGSASHAEGKGTIASRKSQHVFGEYNKTDTSSAPSYQRGNYVEIVGNGTSDSSKSNARTLDWSGNEVLAGKLTVGSGPTNDMDVTTKQYVDTNISLVIDDTAGTEDTNKTWSAGKISSELEGAGSVKDVTVNDVSIVDAQTGIAAIPIASNVFGLVRSTDAPINNGIEIADGAVRIPSYDNAYYKNGNYARVPVTVQKQHVSIFYGLAKAAGDTTQSASDNAVGTYTDNAKSAIQNMLGIADNYRGSATITVTDANPVIQANRNSRYMCGEVLSLDFTPCASGICEVIFTSGSSLTVLTLPETVKMPEWFEIETNHVYDISIVDGVYGAVMVW